jgi:5-methylcytosine-specific restriction endonuclease McrA
MALTAKYYKENPEKKAALSARRHASKLQRTPKWLTPADWIEMKWAYQIAHDLTVLTGIPHQVDHILPLQGKNVSGLHCPQNLQIITQAENCRKGNKF